MTVFGGFRRYGVEADLSTRMIAAALTGLGTLVWSLLRPVDTVPGWKRKVRTARARWRKVRRWMR